MRLQAKVYGQNLGKAAEERRALYNRTFQLGLAKGKNFIKKNRDHISKPENQAEAKLERLKKLQLRTQMLLGAEGSASPTDLQTKTPTEAEQFLVQSIKNIIYANAESKTETVDPMGDFGEAA